MEKWRKDYLRKMKTKAWTGVDFNGYIREVIYVDDGVDHETVSLKVVLEEIIWHWEVLNETENANYHAFNNRQKRAFKKVANNFLKKYYEPEKVSEFYRKMVRDGQLA